MVQKEVREGMADVINGEITDVKAMKAHLSSGSLARAYLFYGEEEYLKDLYVSRLRKLTVDDEMNIYMFTGRTAPADIAEVVSAVSLFGERKLVLVSDSGFFKSAEELAFLDDLEDGNCTVIFREDTVDKRTKSYKEFLKKGIAFECKRQEERDILRLMSAKAQAAGRTLSPGAAELLLQGIGSDLTRLLSETEKLILLVEDQGIIREEHVRSACTLSLSARVFDLNDAVAAGNRSKAFVLLQALLDEKQSPLGILTIISRNWVSLYETKLLLEEGCGVTEVQKRLGIHSFVARKLCEQSRKLKKEDIRQKILLAAKMDEAIKSGVIKDTRALELLIS